MLATEKEDRTNKLVKRDVRLTKASQRYQRIGNWLYRRFTKIPSDKTYNISLSQEHRFIWYRVAKVASRTIFDVFDRAEVTFIAEHPYWVRYAPKQYEDYYRFTFVRNPWDRLVSCWSNKVKRTNFYDFSEADYAEMQKFENFVDFVEAQNVMTCNDPHLRMQSSLIDLNHVDFVGRFENFETDLYKVLDALNIKNIQISKKNKSSNRKPYQSYYNERTKQKVAKMYEKDIRIFNYHFDG